MSVKDRRQELIRRVILGQPVESQDILVAELQSRGERVTQATVSRDLKEMGVLKGPEGYRLPPSGGPAASVPGGPGGELARAVREYMLDAEPAGTLVIVRTGAGQASALALRIDRAGWRDIVGTVAGDDTVFVAARSAPEARRVSDLMRKLREGAA
jgi:transcriptional regulator of arginine metabolism